MLEQNLEVRHDHLLPNSYLLTIHLLISGLFNDTFPVALHIQH